MSDQNKATARRLFEEIISEGQLDSVGEVIAADYHEHDPANEVDTRGVDGVREEFEMYRAAFDFEFEVEDQLAEGDEVVTRWRLRGTHTGDFMGIAPTGNQVDFTGMTIMRFGGGKIEEAWWNWDTLGLMRQVGAIPAEQPA